GTIGEMNMRENERPFVARNAQALVQEQIRLEAMETVGGMKQRCGSIGEGQSATGIGKRDRPVRWSLPVAEPIAMTGITQYAIRPLPERDHMLLGENAGEQRAAPPGAAPDIDNQGAGH